MPPRKSKFTDNKQQLLPSEHNNLNPNPNPNQNNHIELVITTVDSNQQYDKNNNNNIVTNQINYITGGEVISTETDLVTPEQFQKGHVNKKRGRKPKGGKIMTNISSLNTDITEIPNIILHLKCHMNDLKTQNDSISNYDYSPSIEDVQSYIQTSQIIQCSDIIDNGDNHIDDDESIHIVDNDNNNNHNNPTNARDAATVKRCFGCKRNTRRC